MVRFTMLKLIKMFVLSKYQLESISGELESTINEAKNFTMQLAVSAQAHLDDKEKLEEISRNMERGYYAKRFRPSVLKEQLVYASESAKEVNAAVKNKVKEELTK